MYVMRRPSLSQLLPNSIEWWYVVFISFAILLIGDGKLLLQRVGLIGSAHLIGQQVSNKVLWGNSALDNLKFTAGVINLIIWGATGLIIYSALQSVVQGLRVIEFERDFDSQQYVHPQGFSHKAYWRQVITNTILGFIFLALFVAGGIIYLAMIVPNSLGYTQRFIIHPGFDTLGDPFIGYVLVFAGTTVIYLLLKLVIRQHRTTKIEE